MNKKVSTILVGLGFLFLINAIVGCYLLWAYSFKPGIYFIILGSTLQTEASHPKMGRRPGRVDLYRVCLSCFDRIGFGLGIHDAQFSPERLNRGRFTLLAN